jgi:hypothetical protein
MDAATITARLGLDIKGFQDGLAKANTAAQKHAGSVNAASGAHDRLLTSSHRVASRVGELARTLASGGSAADAMGVAIEGLGRSLNLPLGALAGLAATGVLVQQIYKTQTEAEKLRADISKISEEGHINPRFESLETLKSRLEETRKKYEELQKAHDSFMATVLRGIGQIGITDKSQKDPVGDEERKQLRESIKREQRAVVEKDAQSIDIEATRIVGGDREARLKEAAQKKHEAISKAYEDFLPEKGPQDKKAFEAAVQNANDLYTLAEAKNDKEEAAEKRQVSLEERLTEIKRDGFEVDIKSAEAKLQYANAALEAANAEQSSAAAAKVHAAAFDLEEATRKKVAEFIRTGTSDFQKSPGAFRAGLLSEARNAADTEAVTRAERAQLLSEIGSGGGTLAQRARLAELNNQITEGNQGGLERERRQLIREQSGYQALIPEGFEGTASAYIGKLGEQRFLANRARLDQIDKQLVQPPAADKLDTAATKLDRAADKLERALTNQ